MSCSHIFIAARADSGRRLDAKDPVTSSYDVLITPDSINPLYLLQYPNRPRLRPYDAEHENSPSVMRIKPHSGHLEVDHELNTSNNFNAYAGLKWGDAVENVGKKLQNESGTYGLADGFELPKRNVIHVKAGLKDTVERGVELSHGLSRLQDGQAPEGTKLLQMQTLGGQVLGQRGVVDGEVGRPQYFVGAFVNDQLHLTRVGGTVQMRPQFHHLDAEDQRSRLLASKQLAAQQAAEGDASNPPKSQVVAARFATDASQAVPKGELELREQAMRQALRSAHEEKWSPLDHVDEAEESAYQSWEERMRVSASNSARKLKTPSRNDEYLEALSARSRSLMKKRRSRKSTKGPGAVDVDGKAGLTDEGGDHAEPG